MGRIHEEFDFNATATDVATSVSEVLRKKAGVCQDFAHLMLACLRSLGLPARYVSGYLETKPPEGKERLTGADASHAWVSVFCGEAVGWVDADPTNNLLSGERHITVAWGRDYSDVSPLRGVTLGAGGQRLSVAVDMCRSRLRSTSVPRVSPPAGRASAGRCRACRSPPGNTRPPTP